jgi:translation elongation factor EF-Tu-like GTPase
MSRFTPPTPDEKEERRRLLALPFRMPIEDVFVWKGQGRGVIVTGRAESGTLKPKQTILILGDGVTIQTSVVRFEGFIRDPDSFVAEASDNLAILLHDVEKDQLECGMIVTTKGL